MWNLDAAIKKLSWRELRERWHEYQQLDQKDKWALQSYAVIAMLFVGVLTGITASYMHRPQYQEPDRLGLFLKLTH